MLHGAIAQPAGDFEERHELADGMDVADRRYDPPPGAPHGEPVGDARADTQPGDLREDEEQEQTTRPSREHQHADGGAQDDGGKRGTPAAQQRKRRSPLIWIILFIVAVGLIGAGTWYYLSTVNLETTDDAYTDGYAPTIAPQVSGQVQVLAVRDNQFVHAGDVLIRIDDRQYVAARDQAAGNLAAIKGQLQAAQYATEVGEKNFPAQLAAAQAQLASAQAQLFKTQADARRQHAVPRAATTQQEVDNADAALMAAQAQVREAQARVQQNEPVPQNIGQTNARVQELDGQRRVAEAQLAKAELDLSWTVVRAPQDGWVTKRGVNAGDYVTPGQAIMTLVTPDVWVTANFKETQLDRIRVGQKVDISLDAYPDRTLHGHIDSLQLGSGARFSAFPAENATGNFVKIVRRVPVKIDIDSGLDANLPLPLGISVVPSVHLK
jgi:membrane fusion protein, multidrug efflux system